MEIITYCYQSPCGELTLGSYGENLCLCGWHSGNGCDALIRRLNHALDAEITAGKSEVISRAITLLDSYFAGEKPSFDLPMLFVGTEFQQMVWDELTRIPYGKTITYAEEAARIGRPTAVRAVASANRANPISIFAPCHRVIGSDGSMTGYGGGLDVKRYLLNLESDFPTLL